MDFSNRVRTALCTCSLCVGVGATIELAHAVYPNECGLRREVITCGVPEAIMPEHGPHGTDAGTQIFLRLTAAAASGTDINNALGIADRAWTEIA